MILWLTEFPFMLAISFNFLNTPPAVKLAGWNIILWLLRELSATRPKSPFSWASALILSNCRPRNKSKLVSSSHGDGWWVRWVSSTHPCIYYYYYQLLEQQPSSAPSPQHLVPSPGMQDQADSNTGTRSSVGHLTTEDKCYWRHFHTRLKPDG